MEEEVARLRAALAEAEAREREAQVQAERERKAREEERREKEAARLVSVYLSGDLVDRLGEGNPKEAEELTELYTTLTRGWKANPGLCSAGATPEKRRGKRQGGEGVVVPGSTEKDSVGSHSAQSDKSAMHGFQLTPRHAYVWEKWELGVEALFDALKRRMVGCDLDAWVETWVAGARLLHISRGTMSEEQQQHPLLGMWLESVVAHVFGGEVEVVHEKTRVTSAQRKAPVGSGRTSVNYVTTSVPVYTNAVWEAKMSRSSGGKVDKDANKARHQRRAGWIDFVVRNRDGDVIMVIEVKQPVPSVVEGTQVNRSKGQVIVQAAGVLQRRRVGGEEEEDGTTPVYGLLTDMRYRVNLLLLAPVEEKGYARRGDDEVDEYPASPWTFAMSEARKRGVVEGETTTTSDGAGPSEPERTTPTEGALASGDDDDDDWEPDGGDAMDEDAFDEDRSRWAAKNGIVGLAIAIMEDWDEGIRAREAGEEAIARGLAELEASLGRLGSASRSNSDNSDNGRRRSGGDGGAGSDGGGSEEEEEGEDGEEGSLDDEREGDTPDQGCDGSQGRMSNDRRWKGKRKRKRDRIPLSSLMVAQTPNRERGRWSYPDEATLKQCAPPMSASDRIRVWLQQSKQ